MEREGAASMLKLHLFILRFHGRHLPSLTHFKLDSMILASALSIAMHLVPKIATV